MTEKSAELAAIEKLETLINEHQLILFDEHEAEALRKFAKFMIALETLGSAGIILKNVLSWLGFMIAAYLAVKAGLVEWILGLIRDA